MSHAINWNVDNNEINGIPEPPPPSNSGMSGSVADIILQGFMAILNYFNENVLTPDTNTLNKLKQLSTALNQLKTLLNDLTSPNLPSDWGSQVNQVLGNMQSIIAGLPPGQLQTQLESALGGVQSFLKSPFAQQFAQWVTDLQNFQTIWNQMLTDSSFSSTIVNNFRNALNTLDGDRSSINKILAALPAGDTAIRSIFENAHNQFDNLWNNLMDIESGPWPADKSLYDAWTGNWQDSLSDWVQCIMVVEGNAPRPTKWIGQLLKVHQFDNFQQGKYLANLIAQYQRQEKQNVDTQALGELVNQMAQNQNPYDTDSLYNQMGWVWNAFQGAVSDVSEAVSAAQSLNQQFVVDVNSDMTEYQSILQLFVQEIAIPIRAVDSAINRVR